MDKLVPKKYIVLEFYRETKDDFTLKVNMVTDHAPGQFVQVSLPGVGESPISICSDSRKHIQLNVREVGNVTRALAKLRKGDSIFIRGPYGNGYPLEKLTGKSLVIIGGGCGVASLRGVIEYIENHRDDYKDVTLFFGYRSPDDIIFNRDMDGWKGKFSMTTCVDKVAEGKLCYDAKVGFVTDVLKTRNIFGENCTALICGPPIMIKLVVNILKKKGFNDDQIFISAERLMYCATGTCCHCMIREKFTCVDGPVFRYDKMKKCGND